MTVDGCLQALEKYNVEKDIAAFIKKEFDKKYNPTWHAIVGRNFGKPGQQHILSLPWVVEHTFQSLFCIAGSYVTHETKHFIYFYLGEPSASCWCNQFPFHYTAKYFLVCCCVVSYVIL